jgi:hypothetical protein
MTCNSLFAADGVERKKKEKKKKKKKEKEKSKNEVCLHLHSLIPAVCSLLSMVTELLIPCHFNVFLNEISA